MKPSPTARMANLWFAIGLCGALGCATSAGPAASGSAMGSTSAANGHGASREPFDIEPFDIERPPSRGPADAPVLIEAFGDFECPYCALGAFALDRVEQLYPKDVRVEFRNFPLPHHVRARSAANAALSAYEQGGNTAFWRLHDRLFESHRRKDGPALGNDELTRLAASSGVDPKVIEQAIHSDRYSQRIDEDVRYGEARGIRATPTFIVNGFRIEGAAPVEVFQHIIEALLRQRREQLKKAI